jgi:hypothetical protein
MLTLPMILVRYEKAPEGKYFVLVISANQHASNGIYIKILIIFGLNLS